MFKIYDEPASPSKGGVFKICDEPECQMSGRVWGGGVGAAPPPNPPCTF